MKQTVLALLLGAMLYAYHPLAGQTAKINNLITLRIGDIKLEGVPDSAVFYPVFKKAWVNSLIAYQREGNYKLLDESDSTADNVMHITYKLENLGHRDQQTVVETSLVSAYSPFVGTTLGDVHSPSEIGKDVLSHRFNDILNADYFRGVIIGHFFVAKLDNQPCKGDMHQLFLKQIKASDIDEQRTSNIYQILLNKLAGISQNLDLPFCFVEEKKAGDASKIVCKIEKVQDRYRISLSFEEPKGLNEAEHEVYIDSFLIDRELYRPFVDTSLGALAIRFLHKAVSDESEEDDD